LNAAAVVINIVTIGGGGSIIAVALLSPLPSLLPLLFPPSPLLLSLSMMLRQHCFVIVIIIVLLGSQSEELGQITPQRHCPWHVDGPPTLGLAARGPAALTQGHYVPEFVLSEISWCLSNGSCT
jgi:hypothetical protein